MDSNELIFKILDEVNSSSDELIFKILDEVNSLSDELIIDIMSTIDKPRDFYEKYNDKFELDEAFIRIVNDFDYSGFFKAREYFRSGVPSSYVSSRQFPNADFFCCEEMDDNKYESFISVVKWYIGQYLIKHCGWYSPDGGMYCYKDEDLYNECVEYLNG